MKDKNEIIEDITNSLDWLFNDSELAKFLEKFYLPWDAKRDIERLYNKINSFKNNDDSYN